MRRLCRYCATNKLVGICRQSVRFHSDGTLEVISHEMNLLNITAEYHTLNLCPFNLGWSRAALTEKHPAYTYEQEEIEPGKIQPDLDFLYILVRFLIIIVFCHLLCS